MSTAAAIVTVSGSGVTHLLPAGAEWTLCRQYVATTVPSRSAYATCSKCTKESAK